MTTNKLDIQAIRERCDKATPGPWKVHKDDIGDEYVVMVSTGIRDITGYDVVSSDGGLFPWDGERKYSESDSNAEFIAYARTDLPEALDEIERLRTELLHIAHCTTLSAANTWARQALEG